jgi:hypothetical protein
MNLNIATNDLAIIISVITAIAVVINSINYRIFAKKTARIAAYGKIHDQEALIMKEILQYNLSPVAAPPEIIKSYVERYDREKHFVQYGAILFHHINLLNIVYINKDVLSSADVYAFRNWFRKVVKPWIKCFPDLSIVMKGILDGNDGYTPKFVEWLRQDFESE